MKYKKTKFFYLAIAFASLVVNGCSDDWIWEPGPGPTQDLSGTVTVVDSIGLPVLGNWSGIPVFLMQNGYPYSIVDSTLTDANGNWKIQNAPSGDDDIAVLKPAYSASLTEVHVPVSALTGPYNSTIGVSMKHTIVLDSIVNDIHEQDTALAIYGHDPSALSYCGWNILLCCDTTRNFSTPGLNFADAFAEIYGNSERNNAGAFWGEMEQNIHPATGSTSDTLYIEAFAVNTIESQELLFDFVPPRAQGYRTCGPPSNVIAIPRK